MLQHVNHTSFFILSRLRYNLNSRTNFESLMKIGHCVLVKVYILDQNSAGGRFLRFVARFDSHVLFCFFF